MTENKGAPTMLYVLFAAAFIAGFNENIINVALTDIMAAFAIDANTANWLVTGYMIVTSIVVTAIAFLLRRFSLRTLFFGGAALFIVGSVLALVAPTFPLLLICRLLQAVGTGVFIPTMMNTTLAVAPRKRLGTFLSIGGCCITFGPAFGPVVSGFMATMFGWRAIFIVPVAAMVVILIAGAVLVRDVGTRAPARLDVVSLVLSAVGLTALVYGLSQLTGNLVPALIAIVVGVCVIALFVRRQGRIDEPLLNMAPLKYRQFSSACVLVVVAMMTTFSMSVLLPLYFQGSLGADALLAGMLILGPILVNAVTAILGGRWLDRRGEWPVLPFGFALIVVGQIAVSIVCGRLEMIGVVLASCVVYAGVGFVFSPSQTAGLKVLPRELNSFGVGIMSTFIQVSAAIGPSLFVGVYSTRMAQDISAGVAPQVANATGFGAAVVVAAAIAAVGMVVAFVFARRAQAASPVADTAAAEHASRQFSLDTIMKRDVYSISSSAPVYAAIEAMLEHKTSGLPVVEEGGAVVGFVSDGDVMKSIGDVKDVASNVYLSLSQIANLSTLDDRIDALMHQQVMDIATAHVISVHADTPIEQVCGVLSERRIKKMPVIDEGKLVGTISRSDVNRFLMEKIVSTGRAGKLEAQGTGA